MPEKKALLVCLDEVYKNTSYSRIPFALENTIHLGKWLQQNNWTCNFLYEQGATADKIVEQIKLSNSLLTQPGDKFLFYYIGHGELVRLGQPRSLHQCLVTYSEREKFSALINPEAFLLDNEFSDVIKQYNLNGTFISILNCCYSGGLLDIANNLNHILIASSDSISPTNYGKEKSYFFEALRNALTADTTPVKIKDVMEKEFSNLSGIPRPYIQFTPNNADFHLFN